MKKLVTGIDTFCNFSFFQIYTYKNLSHILWNKIAGKLLRKFLPKLLRKNLSYTVTG